MFIWYGGLQEYSVKQREKKHMGGNTTNLELFPPGSPSKVPELPRKKNITAHVKSVPKFIFIAFYKMLTLTFPEAVFIRANSLPAPSNAASSSKPVPERKTYHLKPNIHA